MNRFFPTEIPTDGARRKHEDTPIHKSGLAVWRFEAVAPPADRAWHPRLVGVGAVLLIAAWGTDAAYAHSLLFEWENFSMWLLTAGLVLAAFAGIALSFDIASYRTKKIDMRRFGGFAVAAMLSLWNVLVHSRDAYTAVVPTGLELSTLVSAILLILGWRGWSVGNQTIPANKETKE